MLGGGFANGEATISTLISSGATSVTVGANSSCLIMTSGQVKCWGQNSSGQLGDGTTNDSAVPVDIIQY
jgi:alpha-tubulin suppressor-like RCC1 family protein